MRTNSGPSDFSFRAEATKTAGDFAETAGAARGLTQNGNYDIYNCIKYHGTPKVLAFAPQVSRAEAYFHGNEA